MSVVPAVTPLQHLMLLAHADGLTKGFKATAVVARTAMRAEREATARSMMKNVRDERLKILAKDDRHAAFYASLLHSPTCQGQGHIIGDFLTCEKGNSD